MVVNDLSMKPQDGSVWYWVGLVQSWLHLKSQLIYYVIWYNFELDDIMAFSFKCYIKNNPSKSPLGSCSALLSIHCSMDLAPVVVQCHLHHRSPCAAILRLPVECVDFFSAPFL